MEISVEQEKNQTVIQICGRMDSQGAAMFGVRTSDLDLPPNPKVILDLKKLSFIGSTGIGKLLSFLKSMTLRSGEVTIINLNDDLKFLFQIMKLDRIFQIEPG